MYVEYDSVRRLRRFPPVFLDVLADFLEGVLAILKGVKLLKISMLSLSEVVKKWSEGKANQRRGFVFLESKLFSAQTANKVRQLYPSETSSLSALANPQPPMDPKAAQQAEEGERRFLLPFYALGAFVLPVETNIGETDETTVSNLLYSKIKRCWLKGRDFRHAPGHGI